MYMTIGQRIAGAAMLMVCVAAGLAAPAAAQQPTQAQQNAIRQSCRNDFQANCSGVPTGGSAALSCLQQHAAQLSAPCQGAVSAVSGGGGAASTPTPRAEAIQCLEDHAHSLSPGCREMLSQAAR